VGLDALCHQGQRLLGLGRYLAGRQELLVEALFFPLLGPEDEFQRLPGHRVRRFFLQRQDQTGRIHFLDGTPTEAVVEADHDDQRVLEWLGWASLPPGERQWFDLAARPADSPDAAEQPAVCAHSR
jgi:hypothetical protein